MAAGEVVIRSLLMLSRLVVEGHLGAVKLVCTPIWLKDRVLVESIEQWRSAAAVLVSGGVPATAVGRDHVQ